MRISMAINPANANPPFLIIFEKKTVFMFGQ
jgi:hypothetical protein